MSPDDRSGADLVCWLDDVARRAADAHPGAARPLRYGPGPEQVVDLWGDPAAQVVVVLVHGGYFASEYDRSGTEPLCRRLAAAGLGVANVEYRRTGSVADPLDSVRDVRLAIRAVRGRSPSAHVVLVGHSAGGYLALTGSVEPGVRAVVALAPATLLSAIDAGGHDGGALRRWVGRDPEQDRRVWDRLAPERVGIGPVPIRVLHGRLDSVVPAEHSARWVRDLADAGRDVSLTLLASTGHYEFLDPASRAADAVEAAVRAAARR